MKFPPYRWVVEEGQVLQFQRALTRDHSRSAVPRPPLTYMMTGGLWGPSQTERLDSLGFDTGAVVHGEQAFEYLKPLRIGATYTVSPRVLDVRTTNGARGGRMTIVAIESVVVDESNDAVLKAVHTSMEYDRSLPDSELTSGGPDAASGGPHEVSPGDPSPVRIEGLTLTDVVRYAGASGDFNPLHHDREHAVSLGYADAFVMGMLPGGILANYASDWLGHSSIRRLKMRFVDRIEHAEPLECRGRVTAVDSNGDFSTVTADIWIVGTGGQIKVKGSCTAHISEEKPF